MRVMNENGFGKVFKALDCAVRDLTDVRGRGAEGVNLG